MRSMTGAGPGKGLASAPAPSFFLASGMSNSTDCTHITDIFVNNTRADAFLHTNYQYFNHFIMTQLFFNCYYIQYICDKIVTIHISQSFDILETGRCQILETGHCKVGIAVSAQHAARVRMAPSPFSFFAPGMPGIAGCARFADIFVNIPGMSTASLTNNQYFKHFIWHFCALIVILHAVNVIRMRIPAGKSVIGYPLGAFFSIGISFLTGARPERRLQHKPKRGR